jgi:UDP-4-amino-4,6-dideoxy-N-acetyl-beta-L-altrosamine transaminase
MTVPFIPYSCQNISEEDVAAVCNVLRSTYLTQGPSVGEFEEAFAARHVAAHAIAVSNATAGLHIACLALGVTTESHVWTTPNSFVASANCALYCGAKVDFVDIDPLTRNLSVQSLRVKLEEAAIEGKLPAVVIPIDFAGLPCDLREIRELAERYGFRILEDASHATGATYQAQPVGSQYADATVFSFHAVKVVTTAEGGLVTTRDARLASQLRQLRSHGIVRDRSMLETKTEGDWYYEQQSLGFNYRMTDIQAALGLSQLRRLTELQSARQMLADRYDQLLADLPLVLPRRLADRESAWHLYVIEIDESKTYETRLKIFQHLRSAGIGVNVHYIPIHLQPYFRRMGFKAGDFPNSERYYSRALSIPLFPAMTTAQQDVVVESLSHCFA